MMIDKRFLGFLMVMVIMATPALADEASETKFVQGGEEDR